MTTIILDSKELHAQRMATKKTESTGDSILDSLRHAIQRSLFFNRSMKIEDSTVSFYSGDKVIDKLSEINSSLLESMSSHPEKMQEIENVLIDHLGGVPSIVITEYSWAELSRFDYSVDVTDDQKMRMYSMVYGVYMMMFPMFYGFFTEMTTNDAEDSMVFSDFWKEKNLKDAALAGFGFWRRDVGKMIAKSPWKTTQWISLFRDHLTPDQIVRAFNDLNDQNYVPDHGVCDSEDVDLIMENVTHPNDRYSFVTCRDIRGQAREISYYAMCRVGDDGRARGWERMIFNEDYSDQRHEIFCEGDMHEIIDATKVFESIDNTDYHGYTLKVLNTKDRFVHVGTTLNVCCAAKPEYYVDTENGYIILVSLYKKDTPVALMYFDIRDGVKVVEAKGKDNADRLPGGIDVNNVLAMIEELKESVCVS